MRECDAQGLGISGVSPRYQKHERRERSVNARVICHRISVLKFRLASVRGGPIAEIAASSPVSSPVRQVIDGCYVGTHDSTCIGSLCRDDQRGCTTTKRRLTAMMGHVCPKPNFDKSKKVMVVVQITRAQDDGSALGHPS